LRKIPPAGFLIVHAAGDTGLDMAALQARHLQRRVHEVANSDNVLLEQLDDEDELSTLAEEV
jgi:hypothetical protein